MPADGNRLIGLMSDSDRDNLQFEPVRLEARFKIEETAKQIRYVYFFDSGMASIVYKGTGDDRAEIAVVGREGCSGCSVILGSRLTPQGMVMQIAGNAQRVEAERLQGLMDESRHFRHLMLHYVHTAIIQRDETALAASRASIEQRLARWLLMSQDRTGSEEIKLTHDLISVMLSCRRAGVTTALGLLHNRGLVSRGGRGYITVLDRQGLKDVCRPYYGAANLEFARLFPGGTGVPQDPCRRMTTETSSS